MCINPQINHGMISKLLQTRVDKSSNNSSDITTHPTNEFMKYTAIPGYTHANIIFENETWSPEDIGSSLFHPLVTPNALTELLVEYSSENQEKHNFVAKLTNLVSNQMTMTMLHGITLKPNSESSLNEYNIYATPSYRGFGYNAVEEHTNPRYDGVELWFGDTEISEYPMNRVLGIIKITEKGEEEGEETILLIVTTLESVPKSRTDNFLPYDLLKYTTIPGRGGYMGIQVELVDVKSIYRPCMLIPDTDRSNYYNAKFHPKFTKLTRIWGIPYRTIDRTGYSISITSLEMDTQVRNEEYDANATQPLFLNSHAIAQMTAFLRSELDGGDEENDGTDNEEEGDDILAG